MGASGRHFKLDAKNRFLVLLAYYRLYIKITVSNLAKLWEEKINIVNLNVDK